MSDAPTTRKRLWAFLMGISLGLLIGFLVGVVLTGLCWWAYSFIATEEALDPLAELNIDKERLSTSDTKGYIDRLAKQCTPTDGGGIAIGITVMGESHVYGYGSTSEGGNVPEENTVFELASAGKTFAGLLLAEMAMKHEVALDDPIEKFLPHEVKAPQYNGQSIRLVDLATQTSGLPRLPLNFEPPNLQNPYAAFTVEKMYEGLGEVQIESPIGRTFEYSNLGIGLLGHVLALRADTTYEDLVIRRICEPLGMFDTKLILDENLNSRLAVPHDDGKPVEAWDMKTLAAAGGFVTTAHDMLLYLEAHWDETTPLFEAMRLAIQKRRPTDTPATAIGLTWYTDSENALDIVWHNGATGGTRSYITMLPDRRMGVVVLSNSSSTSVEELGKKVVYLLLRHESLFSSKFSTDEQQIGEVIEEE